MKKILAILLATAAVSVMTSFGGNEYKKDSAQNGQAPSQNQVQADTDDSALPENTEEDSKTQISDESTAPKMEAMTIKKFKEIADKLGLGFCRFRCGAWRRSDTA